MSKRETTDMEQSTEDPTDSPRELDGSKIYELSSAKLFKHKQKIERRKNKEQLGDRRSSVRFHINGEPQLDRRKTNRADIEKTYGPLKKPV